MGFGGECPWFSGVERTVGRVESEEGGEASKLYPSGHQVIVLGVSPPSNYLYLTYLDTKHMSSDIVTPLPISDVASSSSELRLELKTGPRDNRILLVSPKPATNYATTNTRESNGIPVTSRASISGEGESPIILPA